MKCFEYLKIKLLQIQNSNVSNSIQIFKFKFQNAIVLQLFEIQNNTNNATNANNANNANNTSVSR